MIVKKIKKYISTKIFSITTKSYIILKLVLAISYKVLNTLQKKKDGL